jgi:imidazolonepropionase-like amidohydrolase
MISLVRRRRNPVPLISALASVVLLALWIAACTSGPPLKIVVPDGAVILSGASVYLGDGRTLDDALLVIDGERILAVAPRPGVDYLVPASARVIDLKGKTILPGFLDLHTHLGADGCFAGPMSEQRLRRELRADLANGVTTVLDLGSTPWLQTQRNRSLSESWDAPEILLAGPMITVPGGHPVAAEGPYAGMARRVGDTEQARLAVGEIADGGADVIKAVLESGGFGGMPPSPTLSFDELAAIADEAHARGLKLFVHVSTTADAREALEAGADVLAHVPISGSMAGTDLPVKLAKAGVPVVSTLSAFEGFFRLLDLPAYADTPDVVQSVDPDVLDACRGADVVAFADTNPFTVYARGQIEVAAANIAALRAAGASVVLGTDAGNLYVFHGPAVHRELRLLVQAGMAPAEAVDAATVHAAEAIGRSDIGSVRPGRRADLLVIDGNPARKIDDVDRIEIVVRAGRFYDRADL